MSQHGLVRRSLRIVFYCPDRHMQYDGRILGETGVGGGVSSRIRLAEAMAKRGHAVEIVCNCEGPIKFHGVQYSPLSRVSSLTGDAVIANTSGDKLDISSVRGLEVDAALRILWISGVIKPKGIGDFAPNLICAKSRFLSTVVRSEWGLLRVPIVVIYNGYVQEFFERDPIMTMRDPYRLAYASHPDKGLTTALAVLERLRASDERFHLLVAGSKRLWGQEEVARHPVDGVEYLGLLRQRDVASVLVTSSFSICLQSIREGFGQTLLESMRAGCCVVASDVGAYSELVEHGVNGILIDGPHESERVVAQACEWVTKLSQDMGRLESMRSAASSLPFCWDSIAGEWERMIADGS
jgi:glycosyltransferase involved in cell wall biosynthesis